MGKKEAEARSVSVMDMWARPRDAATGGAGGRNSISRMSIVSAIDSEIASMGGEVLDKSPLQKGLNIAKLVVVSSPSLLVAGVLTFINLEQVNRSRSEGLLLQTGLEDATAYNALQSRMAVERGMTCVTLNSVAGEESKYLAVYNTLKLRRRQVDERFGAIRVWYGTGALGPDFVSLEAFRTNLTTYRSDMDATLAELRNRTTQTQERLARCSRNLDFYTRKIDLIIELAMIGFTKSKAGKFWLALEGDHHWNMYLDLQKEQKIAGEMALRRSQFATPEDRWKFIERSGASGYFLRTALKQVPGAKERMANIEIDDAVLVDQVEGFRTEVKGLLGSPTPNATETPFAQRSARANLWFQLSIDECFPLLLQAMLQATLREMERLVTRLKSMGDDVFASLVSLLDAIVAAFWTSLLEGVYTAVVVLLIVPPLVVWYLYSGNKKTKTLDGFMERQWEQSLAIDGERKRSEQLLDQMLPKSIARTLKRGGHCPPESFDEATLFFSDIVGFSNLASCSTAFQLIELLNALYTYWDDILEQYSVYKVETIADSYVVASGVPLRNGFEHSAEVASLALSFISAMDSFQIPYLPGHKLLVRIGMHTGPIAAGVVGKKMPRYCLFGDTINTAARTQTSSKGLRIQMSAWTHKHIEDHHKGKFITKLRGVMAMKGKGEVETFWLLGKVGQPYRIDLDMAEEECQNASYAKDD